MIVAVDGYSSTGKSTAAKLVASELGMLYIDSGAMYRAVTLFALRNSLFDNDRLDEEGLKRLLPGVSLSFERDRDSGDMVTLLNGENVEREIRSMDVSERVSIVSAIPFVRAYLVTTQHAMAEGRDVVMDGRDIGSVVFPDADVKFFLTASIQIRAERRYKEYLEDGVDMSFEEVEENIRERDYRDSHRSVSPLVQLPDAVVIDSGNMSVREVVDKMISVICERRGRCR